MNQAPQTLPMSGITVIDLTQIYNGPYATFLMAMAGANVIKVEPPGGEYLRRRDARSGAGVPFAMLNANKRSVSLNLKTERGRDLFLALVAKADVVAENFAPGVMKRLGLDYPALQRVNSRIILASGSGYGQTGPYCALPAMDLTIQAMSGLMSVTGFPDTPPVKAGAAMGDFTGGVHLFGAIATALLHRERHGVGSWIDVAMIEAVYPTLASNIGGLYGATESLSPRNGNRHGGLSLCPYNVYAATDGYVAIICNHDDHWRSLIKAMDREDLGSRPEFATMRERVARLDQVDELVEAWTSQQARNSLVELLNRFRVPTAPVRELREVVSDPHMRERGMIFEIDHPTYGHIVVCRSPINFAGVPHPEYRISPNCGADNEAIFSELLGLPPAELDELEQKGIV